MGGEHGLYGGLAQQFGWDLGESRARPVLEEDSVRLLRLNYSI